MKKFLLRATIVVLVLGLILGSSLYVIHRPGTWEDDPLNWYRAFNERSPSGADVVHSKYWRSGHFTFERAFYFEVRPTPAWRDTFLQKRDLHRVPADEAREFNRNSNAAMTPSWFTSDPLDDYESWDIAGHHGSVWIRKSDGHIFFFQVEI